MKVLRGISRARRRILITTAHTMAIAAICPLAAQGAANPAASYPSKPIRIIVPYAAGGGTDLEARMWAQSLQKNLGQSVIVENMAGSNGMIGTAYAAKAAPDGYTLYIATYGFPVVPLLMKSPRYTVADFAPIIRIGAGPLALVVAANSPFHSTQDVIAAARAKPSSLNVGTLGNGSQEQMGSQKFQKAAKVRLTEIPYKGGAPAMVDLMGGRLQLMFEALPTVMSYIKSGTIRALGVTSARRSSQLPNVPTLAEQGLQSVEVTSWYGFLAPAKTPSAYIEKLNAAFRKGLSDPKMTAQMAKLFGSEPVGGTAASFSEFLSTQTRENADLIAKLGIERQ